MISTEGFMITAEEMCKHFICQKDSNGDIAIFHCSHVDNPSEYEGNCTSALCPLGSVEGDY